MSNLGITTLTMTSPGVPVGGYQGVFVGVEATENQYGQGLKWQWRITSGEHSGKIVQRITGASPSPKNACGKMLAALAGRMLTAGEPVDLAAYADRTYTIVVSSGGEGSGTRVETVTPAN